MGNFNKGKKFGGGGGGQRFGGGNRGGRSFGGGKDRTRPEMHKATCSDCNKSCEVPFKPTGDKPVFCSDCFGNKRGDSQDNRGGSRDRNSRPRFENKRPAQSGGQDYTKQFDILNAKMDKILKALNSDVTEEIDSMSEAPKYKRFERAPKKEVDTAALRETLIKTKEKRDKKPVAKKVAVKKAPVKKVVKKAPVKKASVKKVVAKKAPVKKVVAKKTTAKKVVKKAVIKKKK